MKNKHLILLSIFGGIIGFLVLIGIWYASTYNSLVNSKQTVEAQWGQVETQLQRRNDLTPQLVGAVKGSMKQEKTVFGEIANARKSYNSANTTQGKMKASQQMDKGMTILINDIHENYPQLASNKNVQTLMIQVEGSENRISQERRAYNQDIESFNTQIMSFPKNIIAGSIGYHSYPYFKASAGSNKAPKVNLN